MIDVGAAPFGVAYEMRLVNEVTASFDAVLTAGGRFACPAEWYLAPAGPGIETDRLDVEKALIGGFLASGKPVLGMCAGMQTLACLHGARLTPSVDGHDQGVMHDVTVMPGSRLHALVGPTLTVNSHHREAIGELPPGVLASALSADGLIEAIELPAHPFAVGLQWHQELLGPDHPGQAIFAEFGRATG